MRKNNPSRTGSIAAILALVFGSIYSLAQIGTLLHFIPAPYTLVAMFVPSLLLAPAFVVTMAALHDRTEGPLRLYSFVGVCFALVYCAFVSLVYFGQLAAILPLQLKGGAVHSQFLFQGTSFMVAIDCIGYGFMSMATLFAAFAFRKTKGLYRSFLFTDC